MKKRLCIYLAAVTILFACRKPAQPGPGDPGTAAPKWTIYNKTNAALADNQVNAIAIDKNDVKWVGTANGLVRINGDVWTIFNTGNSALPSAFIQAVAVEENGTVWAGTNKGLAKYNGTVWTIFTISNSILPNNGIMSLHYDKLHKKTWIGTAKGLLSAGENNQLELFDAIENDLILSIATDQQGAVWLGTFEPFSFRGRIKKLHNGQWTTNQLDQLGYPSAFPYAVAVDKNNAVIAALSGTSVRTVIRLQNNDWQELAIPANAGGFRTLLLEDGRIWTGGSSLSVFGNTQPSKITIPGSDAVILCLGIDSKGRKWLGTDNGGLVVYDEAGVE